MNLTSMVRREERTPPSIFLVATLFFMVWQDFRSPYRKNPFRLTSIPTDISLRGTSKSPRDE